MKVLCAWCNRTITDPTEDTDDISHGICIDCYNKQKEELDQLRKQINETK